MKYIYYIIITVFISSSISVAAQKFEIHNGDTINYIDENNLKQGFWKIFGRMKKLPDYQPDQVVEQGDYENSRKQGIWKMFYPNGKTKSEIAYVNSRPNGYYKTYYENGELEEEGEWKNNRNVGKFVRKHPNGEVAQEFEFNESGKRDGEQKYYYEDGSIMIVAQIKEGKEEKVTEYYPDGSLKAEKVFVDGNLDVANTKVYEPKTPIKPVETTEKEPVKVVKVNKEEVVNKGTFDGNGQHKLYNKDKQISKDGVFKNYRLIDGKNYKYDENGILISIELIKNGRYIGEAPLPKE
jgi:antitoxin component YwqK of YwqJK toxin-antitoxin module